MISASTPDTPSARLFFVAGESSGDTHGAGLVRALRAVDPRIACEGLGGPRMAAAGMALRHDLASEGIMGFTEVVRHFPRIRRLFLDTLDHLRRSRPDAVVLIDYPGFNIRLARALKPEGIPVIYYISPQVWAWKKKRLRTIARCVSRMLVIFPFEEALYRDAGVPCAYVGHPLLDHLADYVPARRFDGDPVIGVLPGSRAQEIARLMPLMAELARGIRRRHRGARFVVPVVDDARAAQVRAQSEGFPFEVVAGGMYDVLAQARFAVVASGTATLETALFRVPMAIVYKVSPITYGLARLLVDVTHIGMVNIVAGRGIAPEFIQGRASASHILPVALELIEDTPARAHMLHGLDEVRERLGGQGANKRVAAEILGFLERGRHAG